MSYETYRLPSVRGRMALQVAAKNPRQGILIAQTTLAGLSANRRDILTFREYKSERHRIDHVFIQIGGGQQLEDSVLALLR